MTELHKCQLIIPFQELSVSALSGVIKQIILKGENDSARVDFLVEQKVNQIKNT